MAKLIQLLCMLMISLTTVRQDFHKHNDGELLVGAMAPNESSAEREKEYCYATDNDPYMGFATMTTYTLNDAANLSASSVAPAGCKPKQLWMLIRPSVHSATERQMKEFKTELPILKRAIVKAHKKGNGQLCPEDVSLLRKWKQESMDYGPPGTFTHQSVAEMTGIAQRFKNAFPDLLYQPVDSTPEALSNEKPGERTKFFFAPTRQTFQAAVTFARGLYGDSWEKVQLPKTGVRILQLLDYCEQHHDFKTFRGPHIFDWSTELERVGKRLGIEMTVAKLKTMYMACRYQKAMKPYKASPWCIGFTKEDLQVLEYWEDFWTQFYYGPVNEIAYMPACSLARYILVFFLKRITCNATDVDATVNFVNHEVMLSFAAVLGLFNDTKYLPHDTVDAERLWRTSKFAGFGSNFAFILSSCEDDSWWISATLNEVPIMLPGCEDARGCSFERFVSLFGFDDCDFVTICKASL